MFPSLIELRERAWKDLESARLLLDSDPDRAAYLAGYALELMLKGRYAALKKWQDYPERDEIKRRGSREILDHDLHALVALAKAETIKTGAMLDVDWTKAATCKVDQRYTPAGTLERSEVSERLDQIEKIYHQVVDFMVWDQPIQLETALTLEFGLFNFFGYVRNAVTQGWEVWFSAWARPGGAALRIDTVEERVTASLDADLREAVAKVQAFHPEAPVIRAFYQTAMMTGALLHARVMFKGALVIPFGWLPDAYVITCGNWSPDLLQQNWSAAAKQ